MSSPPRKVQFQYKGSSGIRLDQAIAESLPAFSRTQARKAIDAGGVYVNRKRCRIASRSVSHGARIEVNTSSDSSKTAGKKIQFNAADIIFEDEDLLVVNKPSGVPSQSTVDLARNNLHSMLQDFLAERANVARDKVYLAIHHRLDRDTTGVILFTKTKARNKEITDAFRDRTAEKEYLALAEGSPDEDKFLSKRRIDDSADKRGKYSCVDKGGKSAETHFEVLARGALGENRISLIRALPKTGRTHQIRLHLTDLGFPILGDRAYGGQSYSDAAQEKPLMFLHAHKLRILGQEFVAPPPADFTKMILRLKEASSKN